jgi:hypothetical protein
MDNGYWVIFDEVAAYEFETAGTLLDDFWREAEQAMAERR